MKRFSQILVGLIIILFFFILLPDFVFATDSWTATGALSIRRNNSTATVLESGKVLINGGEVNLSIPWIALYDPSTSHWSDGPNMLNSRSAHTTTLLPDGRVLVAGGKGTASYIQTAEIYNPTTNSWTFTATPMHSARMLHTATLLNDGGVLVAGGLFNSSAITGVEVYDPTADTWTSIAPLPVAKRDHTATLLPDGKVLIAGGSGPSTATFVYNPINDSWSSAGNLSFIRNDPAAILLNDERVLVVGGTSSARCSAEIWSPDVNQWTVIQPPNYCREAHSGIKLSDGTVFVIGGFGGLQGTGAGYLNSTEIYNPVTGQWSITAPMITPRAEFPSVMLKSGKVLVVGGANYNGKVAASEIYTPSTTTPTPTPPAKTPLILIPGIGGAEFKSDQFFFSTIRECGDIVVPYIYLANNVVWLDTTIAVTSRCDDYFDVLKLNPDGQTPQYPQIVLNGTFVSLAYGGFIDFFTDNGYELNKTLFLFPYDWRKDISLTASLLDQKIESIKQQTGSTKVDIVTHSMGGLVARNYIADMEKAQKVRKLITLGSPHLGSTEYIKNLMYGGCLTLSSLKKSPICFGVSPSEIKDVLQNLLGGFELIPSLAYFTFYSGEDNLHPFPFRDDRDIDSNNVTGPLNYSQIKTLLTNLGHNTALFTPSEVFHTLDENLTDTNGVEVSIIAGSGINTLGQIIEKYRVNFKGIKIPQRDKITINGDETVPLLSATLLDLHKNLSLLGSAVLYYTNQEHGKLVANGPALNLVNNILDDDTTLPDGVSYEPYRLKGHQLSVHSPVDLHVYDQHGNHTGETQDGDFEANIPGSSYDTIDDAKFIWLPDDGIYTIKFDATGEGSFDFKIRKFENDTNINTIIYKDIPLTLNTHAMTILDTTQSQLPILEVDQDNNGVIDFEVDPTSQVFGDATYDQTPPTTNIILNGTKGNSDWFTNNINVSFNAYDDNSSVSKTEYSLDNGETIQKYNGGFTLSSDGVYKIKAKSTDKAGNEEIPQEMEVKIDKTSPEAKIFIDHSLLDIVVEGIDTNQTMVKKLDNTETNKKDDAIYIVSDLAGNMLQLDVRDRDKEKKDTFRIHSLQYNQDVPIDQPDNRFNINYKGAEQTFAIENEIKIRIKYDPNKNQSIIVTKEAGVEKVKEIKDGLILLELLTNKGQLETRY